MSLQKKLGSYLSLTLLSLSLLQASAYGRPVSPAGTDTGEESRLVGASTEIDSMSGTTSAKSTNRDQDRKEIEALLAKIEKEWNAHNLDGVMSCYADEYVNNDGLDKKAVTNLTQDFWKTYPDVQSSSKIQAIRFEGLYATVESEDSATGTTAKEMPGVGTKGELGSTAEGQLYLKKLGPAWKIVGDRIDYEKVKLSFGLAKQLDGSFSAPEQVKAGHQYTARLELALPPGMSALGSITSQPLQYPQPQPTESWRPMESPLLERVMNANNKNHNELLMATVGITNAARSSLLGIVFLTRRLNVVPSPVVATEEKAVPSNVQASAAPKTPAEKTIK
jgi:hypothetical protein